MQNTQNDVQTLAQRDEENTLKEGIIQLLQQRTIGLNVEVRLRDSRIAELEAQVADLQAQLEDVNDSANEETIKPE